MKRVVVGIAGGSGSGKSTVARRIARSLRGAAVTTVDMDAYYRNLRHLSADQRRVFNWDHPDAFDVDLFLSHIRALASGMAVEKPVYDFVTHVRLGRTIQVEPADVIVTDGILLLADARVRELCDVKVYVDTDADIRLLRRIRRDMRDRGRPLEEILEQYLSTVRPMHLEFVEPSKRYADVIVPMGGHDSAAVDMIVARIERDLQTARA